MKLSKSPILFGIGFLLILSLILTISPLIFKKSVVTIASISKESACKDILLPGSTVEKINEINIKTVEDFNSAVNGLEGRINLMVNGGPRVCEIEQGKRIDAKVIGPENKGIRFGVDITGGKEIILESENVSGSLSLLKTRLKNYGLNNFEFKGISGSSFGIVFSSDYEYKVEKMLEPGAVSVKFVQSVDVRNGTGKFTFNDKSYNVVVNNSTVLVDGESYKIGDILSLDDIEIEVKNITQNYTVFFLNIFDDKDVKEVLTTEQNSRLFKNKGEYVYVLNALISEEAGERFAKVTKGQPAIINPEGEDYLQEPLIVFADDEIITTVPVLKTDAGNKIDRFVVWGVEKEKDTAERKLLMLISYLKTGRLSGIKIIERIDVPPEKKSLVNLSLYSLLGLSILLCFFSFIRNKNFKIVAVNILVFLGEILLLLGVASSQIFVLILTTFCVVLGFVNNQGHDWKRYITVILMFVISFGAVANKLTVTSQTVLGLSVGISIGLVQFILLNEGFSKSPNKIEKFSNYIWIASFAIVLALAILFFTESYKNVAISFAIALMIGMTITKPEYIKLVNKLKG